MNEIRKMLSVRIDERKTREIKKIKKEREWMGREKNDKFISFFSIPSTIHEIILVGLAVVNPIISIPSHRHRR